MKTYQKGDLVWFTRLNFASGLTTVVLGLITIVYAREKSQNVYRLLVDGEEIMAKHSDLRKVEE